MTISPVYGKTFWPMVNLLPVYGYHVLFMKTLKFSLKYLYILFNDPISLLETSKKGIVVYLTQFSVHNAQCLYCKTQNFK